MNQILIPYNINSLFTSFYTKLPLVNQQLFIQLLLTNICLIIGYFVN